MDKKYLILGDDNFWYGTCGTLKEARQEIAELKERAKNGDSSVGASAVRLYIATEIDFIDLPATE